MKTDGELWALLFFDQAVAKEDEKIVWRMSGGGFGIHVQAQNEEGTIIQPIWGPEYHESSTWKRPGMEFGTGFNFPTPGCWVITVTSGSTIGQIALEVISWEFSPTFLRTPPQIRPCIL